MRKSEKIQLCRVIAEKGLSFEIIKNSGLFPPRKVLNSFFECGIDDAGSSVQLVWEGFKLSEREYVSFFKSCCIEMGPLSVDSLSCDHFSDWFSRAVDL